MTPEDFAQVLRRFADRLPRMMMTDMGHLGMQMIAIDEAMQIMRGAVLIECGVGGARIRITPPPGSGAKPIDETGDCLSDAIEKVSAVFDSYSNKPEGLT